ncbi:MAG: phage tail protein [Novosphingobium sp.]
MATLVLGAIGTLIGGPVGGSIGALLGRSVDTRLLGGGRREGPRLSELRLSTSSYGAPIPRHFGRMRVAGQIIWATDLVERKDSRSGSKGSPAVTSYSYSASFAVALSSRPLHSVGRIWADGKLLRGEAGDMKVGGTFRFHPGNGEQQPDPLIAAAEGGATCPAYRGLAYVVFEDLQLADFGNRIPSLSFEVVADELPLQLSDLADGVLSAHSSAVPLTGLSGLSCEGPLAETLALLDPLFPVDCDAGGEGIAFLPDRRDSPALLLPEAATSSSQDDFGGKTGFVRQRGPESEAPVALLRYYDTERDYQPGAQRAHGRPRPGQPRTLELPAAMTAGAARALIDRAARRSDWNRQTISWRVTQLDPALRPGSTVRLPGHPGLWQVREWEWRDHGVDLQLVRLAPASPGTDHAADPGRVNPPPDQTNGPTGLVVCELPWDGQATTAIPQIVALASSSAPGWAGASLFLDRGDGGLEPLGPSGRSRTVIGTSLTALAPANPLLFDRHGCVTVHLIGADLALGNATMRQLALGANRALLGNEIIQFADAQALGQGDWRLTGLWRGRGGTEAAIATHQPGEPFALLDGSGSPLAGEAIAANPDAVIAAIGLADAGPVTSPVWLRGIGRRPLSPVHGRWRNQPAGGRLLIWTRRARGGWVWNDGFDLPLVEQAEAYEITFGDATITMQGWTSPVPQLAFAPGQVEALLMTLPAGWFEIRQRGDHGLSDPLRIAPPKLPTE